ncbi:MAG TPA: hypothetical protein VFG42_19090 [Baekduia sp.]|uniref:hypothetical protein n=1 Tax=Baekduia sp. TaxID=2600305 RepID=UPI002D798619|nr:hypothetical protein [Baekduia sp.]HET6508907.1 hypothetical protein [Baekduia sp.]
MVSSPHPSPVAAPAVYRAVLDGDWSDAATHGAILPVLATFCRLFGPDDPAELVFATDPGYEQAVGGFIAALLRAVAPDAEPPVLLAKSREEAQGEPSELWITLCGDATRDAVAAADATACLAARRASL